MTMLRKHRDVFAGLEKKLSKLDSCFDMRIEANTKAIHSKGPYPTSLAKRKIIKQFIQDGLECRIIQPSNSEVSSLVIVIM